MNFLKDYCKLLENTEVPARFQIWTGISCLLAMLEKRVWIPQGVYNINPNEYIVLIAASGQKKSTPINIVDKLLRKVENGPNVVAQKVSPEALISAIKTQKRVDARSIAKESAGGIVVADELATFLDRGALDHGLGPILTKLYDCSTFEYQTIKRGTETVRGGYLSILGGTTVELLRSSLPKDAIGGGFTSRTIFVYEDKVAPPVPWVEYDEGLMELEEQLVVYLQRVGDLEGPIQVTPDARAFYERDYKERYNNSEFRRNPALQGYENRRFAHLFKVAMAIMVSETPSLVMEERHIRGAKVLLEEAEEHMPHVMDLIIASDVGAQGNQVYQTIRARGENGISHSELMRHFGNRMNAQELSNVMNTLILASRVERFTNPGSARLMYRAVI